MLNDSRTKQILLADDHPATRLGVRLLLEKNADLSICGECGSTQALRLIGELQPDLTITDLAMDKNGGPDFIRSLVLRGPGTRVLVYSVSDEFVYGERVLRAGAHGYLMKNRPLGDILAAARYVLDGHTYVSEEFGQRLVEKRFSRKPRKSREKPDALANLTDREIQVLRFIGLGRTTGEIARELQLSPKTVGAHRENLKNKLSVDNGAALVREAVTMVREELI